MFRPPSKNLSTLDLDPLESMFPWLYLRGEKFILKIEIFHLGEINIPPREIFPLGDILSLERFLPRERFKFTLFSPYF